MKVSYSQVPGYIGKRFSIGGNFLFGSLAKTRKAPLYNGVGGTSYTLHKSVSANIDFVLTPKTAISVCYKYATMGYDPNAALFYYSYYYYPLAVSKLDIGTFQIGFKYHLSGYIAPLGKYFMYGISYHTARESDPEKKFAVMHTVIQDSTIKFTSFYLGLGTNYIIKDFLILSVSAETDFAFSTNTYTYRGKLIRRWQRSAYLNLVIGIGFLIF